MRKLPARKLLGVVIAAALFVPHSAYTLGLGEIEVNSALNQRLKANIELLSASTEDVESVIVKLASREEFTRAGLDRPYLLNDLRFKAEVINGQPVIKVSSGSPIREPYLSFLVEIDWPNGHMLREYTVLLDPPVFMTQESAQPVAQSAPADSGFRPSSGGSTNVVPVVTPGLGVSSRPSAAPAPAAPAPQATTAPMTAPAQPAAAGNQVSAPVFINQQPQSVNQPAGSYRIQAGDTAWSLADSMRPDQNVSVEQMMLALLRTNPESFINENINGLKRGYILRVPDYDDIMAVNQEEARAMVRQHAALWREYQQNVAGAAPASAMEADSMAGADVIASDAPGDDAYLEIVSAGSGSSLGGKDPTDMSAAELRAELALARERVETERVEKEALQQRVDTLENRVDKMKGMLAIEDQELAEVQSLNQPAMDMAMPEEGSAEEAMMEEMMAEEGAAEEAMPEEAMSEDAMTEETMPDEALADAGDESAESMAEDGDDMPADMAADMADGMAEAGSDEAADESLGEEGDVTFIDEQADVAEEAEPAEPPLRHVSEGQPMRVAERPSDPLSKLLNNPVLLGGVAGGLLLLVGLVVMLLKRRKKADDVSEAPAPVAAGSDSLEDLADDIAQVDDDVQPASLAGDEQMDAQNDAQDDGAVEETQSFDSDSTMILDAADDTVIADSGDAAAAEEEVRDDVIAEADVYLAYGIYQQAEELLSQAISDNPERDDYRVKLAETHYNSKNKDGLINVATELQSRLDDDSAMWKKVVGMGQDLCADHQMFQGSMVGVPMSAAGADEPSMDIDLGLDEPADEPVPDLDLSFDEPEEGAAGDAASDDGALDLDELSSDDSSDDSSEADIEFDLDDTGAVEESEAADDGFSLDIDASELDIATEDTAEAAAAAEEEAIDLGDLDLGVDDNIEDTAGGDVDFALDDDSAAEPAAESVEDDIALDLSDEAGDMDLDLSDMAGDIDVDLDSGSESDAGTDGNDTADIDIDMDLDDSAPEAEPAAPAADDEADDFDLSSLDDVDEVSTKLDLARAYLDMGDHDGTRSILNEVLAEGNDEQKQEANELLAKLE